VSMNSPDVVSWRSSDKSPCSGRNRKVHLVLDIYQENSHGFNEPLWRGDHSSIDPLIWSVFANSLSPTLMKVLSVFFIFPSFQR
jgi:hypothetical protein